MIKKIKTFSHLSSARKLILLQAFYFSIYTYILFTFFKRKVRFGKRVNFENADHQPNPITKDISYAIQAIDKIVPWNNVCRHQAYQAKLLCNYYKIPYTIFVGIKKDLTKNEMQAHAWAVAGGRIITGFCNPNEYILQSIYENQWV